MLRLAEYIDPTPSPVWRLAQQCGVTAAVGGLPFKALNAGERLCDLAPLTRMKQRYDDAGFTLEVIEESQDQVGVEIEQGQICRGFADPLLREPKQELERVPVGRDCAGAHRPLVAQMIDEEALQQGWKGRCGISHRRCPRR